MFFEKEKLIALLIKEGTPLIITAYKNNVAETNLQKAIENNKKYFEEAQKISDKSLYTKKSDKKVASKVVEEEECDECSRPESNYETDSSLGTLPQGVKTEKDPHYKYTVNELAKHLSLLQNHYTDYRCENCIKKHLMVIEGLSEEGVPMTKDMDEKNRFQEVIRWAKKAKDRTDYDDLIDEARDVRIKLTGMEHGDTESDEHEHSHNEEEE